MADSDERGSDPASAGARRDFLKVVGIGGLGAGAAGAMMLPVVQPVTYPLNHQTTSGSDAFIGIGRADRFKDGAPPIKVDVVADQTDSWNRVEQVKIGTAWVRREGGKLVAYSSVCPHLGCGVDYIADKTKYYCACHRSWFSAEGAVETGPCERPLDTLEVKEEGGQVSLRYQKFKLGIKSKEPV